MQRKLFKTLPMVTLMLLALVLSNCGQKEEPAAEKPPKELKKEAIEANVGDEVLAAYAWEEDNFFAAEFYPAKVITKATKETKGEYEVELKYENQMVKHWTKNLILKTHPAKKEELKSHMVVLYVGVGSAPEPVPEEELTYARWRRAYILSTDELDEKGIVKAKLPEGYAGSVHMKNIRICDEPKMEIPEELKQ